jgi:hypothetical protein
VPTFCNMFCFVLEVLSSVVDHIEFSGILSGFCLFVLWALFCRSVGFSGFFFILFNYGGRHCRSRIGAFWRF